MSKNGTHIISGILCTVVIGMIGFMGKVIWADVSKAKDEDIAIRQEINEAKISCDENCEKLRLEIKGDIEEIRLSQNAQGKTMVEMLTILKYLEDKK